MPADETGEGEQPGPSSMSKEARHDESGSSYRVAFLLMPEFSLLGAISAAETLRVANSLYEKPPFSFVFVHDSQPQVPASSGMMLQAETHIRDLKDFDALIVCSSFKHHKYETAETQTLLRRFDRHGKTLGSIEAGVYHLAKSGALNGFEATAHFSNFPLFVQLFPAVRFVKKTYTWAPRRMTCAGGSSATNMMLHLVRTRLGGTVAARVASIMVFPWSPETSEPLSDPFTSSHNGLAQTVRDACRLMEESISEARDMESIAGALGLSRRHLDRMFRQAFSCTAADYYRTIRLSRARKLLKASRMDLTSVSNACGFSSYSHFRDRYKQLYGVTPSFDRRNRHLIPSDPNRLSPLSDLHPIQNQLDPERML